MADQILSGDVSHGGIARRYRDLGDGTWAPVVTIAGYLSRNLSSTGTTTIKQVLVYFTRLPLMRSVLVLQALSRSTITQRGQEPSLVLSTA